jgi:hypothetical protein
MVLARIKVFLVMCIIFSIQPASHAAEAGLGAYWPGYRGFTTGVVPPRPGFYLRNDTVVYSSRAERVVLNGLPVDNVSAHVVVDIIQPLYVMPRKLFGGNHPVLLAIPIVWAKLGGHIIGTNIEPSGRHPGLGDVVVSPLYLGWHKNKLYYNVNLAIFVPTGDYDIHRVANSGRNFWTFDPEFGITYLDPKTGWDVSGALGYSVNSENKDTKYRSGQAVHLDYTFGRAFKNGLKPGVGGYAWVQVTADSGPGAIFGPFKSRVFGIGPMLQWSPRKGPQLTVKYFHEFSARDHLKGNQAVILIRAAF